MRRSLTAGIVLAVALVVAGCGSDAPTATSKVSTAQLVVGAADAATEARTARVSGEMEMAIGGRTMTVPMEGAMDFEHQAASLRVDMSSIPDAPDDAAIEIRILDGSMYMDMGGLLGARAGVLGGRTWVEADMKDFGASETGTQNPGDYLQTLRGAGDVREVGTDEIDGVETRHFRAEVDLSKAIDRVDPKYRDLASKGLSQLGTSFPIDVWIADDGLPRRLELELGVAGKGSVRERMDFSDYGEPVDITAPPADQTMSMAELQALGAS